MDEETRNPPQVRSLVRVLVAQGVILEVDHYSVGILTRWREGSVIDRAGSRHRPEQAFVDLERFGCVNLQLLKVGVTRVEKIVVRR